MFRLIHRALHQFIKSVARHFRLLPAREHAGYLRQRRDGAPQTISGQVTGAAAGSTVTVELGGKTYTATVQADLSWSVSVPAADWQALGNGELTVNASVTNAVGNTGSGTRDITIDASLPGLRVDTVAGDDVVNIIEHSQAQVITGSSSGFAVGTALNVVINNQTYAATVLANGSWSVGVPATDVSNWPAGTLNITVSGANSAGTQTSITHPLTVDLTTVAVSINSITSDDVINAAEKGAALTLSGSTSGVEAGQTVTITFGGKTYYYFPAVPEPVRNLSVTPPHPIPV
nr:Ig-like domain-containing protein [Escherichia coli]